MDNDHSDTRQEKDAVSRANRTAMLFPGIMQYHCQFSIDEMECRLWGHERTVEDAIRIAQRIKETTTLARATYKLWKEKPPQSPLHRPGSAGASEESDRPL